MIGWADAEISAKHCTHASEQSVFHAHPSIAWIALLSGQHDLKHVESSTGAAPGSWTAHMAGFADCVVAVDPAELTIPMLANIRHVRCKAEDAAPHIKTLLSGDADLLVRTPTCTGALQCVQPAAEIKPSSPKPAVLRSGPVLCLLS